MPYCIVLSTSASGEEAEKITGLLLERHLAASVQMTPIVSYYHLKGKVVRSSEIQLLIKTEETLYPDVQSLIKENHSYEVPQIVKIPIKTGLPRYLDWIKKETLASKKRYRPPKGIYEI